MKLIFPLLIPLLHSACQEHSDLINRSTVTSPGHHLHPCDRATEETLMDIRPLENNAVSICRLDGVGDCLHSAEAGRTFEASRPDLDGDGRNDALIRDFTGAYGNHDITHFLGYVSCPSGGYAMALDVFATSAQTTQNRSASGWKEINVTRDCFDDT